MSTDRELLELAAKATGRKLHVSQSAMPGVLLDDLTAWAPLEDDGDALRLAVKLELEILWMLCSRSVVVADKHRLHQIAEEFPKDDPEQSVRRAIVRAAAAIGESMP